MLQIHLEVKRFQALLQTLIRRNFFFHIDSSSEGTSNEYIVRELYLRQPSQVAADADEEALESEIAQFEKILVKAAKYNWDTATMLSFLEHQALPEDHATMMCNVWSKEAVKIRQQLLKDSTWKSTVDDLSWRVDVSTLSKNSSETQGESACLFELLMTDGVNDDNADCSSSVRFEMNRQEVGDILSRLNDIQRVFDDVVGK